MTQKNWFNLTVSPSLYCRYAYIDLGDHLADSLFRRQNISVKFEQEFSNKVSPYRLIVCKVLPWHREGFLKAVEQLPNYLYMTIRRLAGCEESAVTAAVTAAVNNYINNGLRVAEPLIIPRLYAVVYNADPELAQTFAVADIYGNAQGDSQQTRDEITCPWNGKVSILNSGGLTITYRD